MSNQTAAIRLEKYPEVIRRTALSRSEIYRRLEAGKFPKPVKIGPLAVAFVASEIDQFIAGQIAQRDGGAA